MRRILLLMALFVAVPLAGCGKKGPPNPAGPPDQISYPKFYPKPEPFPGKPRT